MVSNNKSGGNDFGGIGRRRFVQAAVGYGALTGFSDLSSAQGGEIQFDGETSGWLGQAPSEIEGETNPTLTLAADREYAVTWTNVDAESHGFAIADDDGNEIIGPTDEVSNEGETQTIEFTAVEEMAEYHCTVHPESMRGAIDIVESDDETDPAESAEIPDGRYASVRDFGDENYRSLYTYRKRRALEVLLSDPEVNDIVADMISSYEAYDPYTGHVDAVSVQGSPDAEIEGGIEEGEFTVTAVDRRVAYGLVDRRTDELFALTITEPRDVSWTAWEGDDDESAQLEQILEDSRVQEYVDDSEWYPQFTIAESITSAGGIEHGDVNPVVLFVDDNDDRFAVVAYLDQREDEVGELLDVDRVERFVEVPPHELAEDVVTADDSVLEEVPDVPFERRPWDSADDGTPRVEEPDASFENSGWGIEWESTEYHGAEITASYQGEPVLTSLETPVTYTGYGLPERDTESTLEWFFPDDDPVFGGELLLWDVHSADSGGPGPLGLIEYPGESDEPEGFGFRSHYHTGAIDPEEQDHRSGYRFGQSNYDFSYDFWDDGTFMPVWRGQGPGFATEYANFGANGEAPTDEANGIDVVQHYVSGITMEITPGTEGGVEVELFDGDEWSTREEEFYRVGEPGMVVRFSNPDGSETVDVLLDDGIEIAVVNRGPREIPVQERIEDPAVESGFYHPAQYVGDESLQDERTVVWLLMEARAGQLPHPSGVTSFVANAELQLSGY